MEKKVTLYSRVQELERWEELFESCVDEETGEIIDSDVLEELKKDLEVQIVEKSSNVVKFYKNRESLINQVAEEIKRLQAFKKMLENRKGNFEKHILYCMENMGKTKIETPNGVIKITNSEAVGIVDESKIPSQFIKIKQEFVEDKVAIKKALKAGDKVPGAILVKRKNLSIK